jgi:hypothetical protein
MNKKLMLLGLCAMGAFSTVLANEPESTAGDTVVVATEDTTISKPAEPKETEAKDKEGCGCKR